MKIVVLLKQTPDTEAKIAISADGTAIETAGVKTIINPYDEFAIEEALQIKAKNSGAEVIVCSFGRPDAKEQIIKGLAMGADRGMLINGENLSDLDSLGISKVLAAAIKKEDPQIVLCGKQGIDDDNMHVPSMVAELLGWAHVNVVTKLEVSDGKARAEREVEGGQVEVYDVSMPAIFGAHKSLNSPRYASLPGIMKAKKKPLDSITPSDLGLDEAALKSSTKTRITGFAYPPEKPAGKQFKDEPLEQMVNKVVDLLRDEANVL